MFGAVTAPFTGLYRLVSNVPTMVGNTLEAATDTGAQLVNNARERTQTTMAAVAQRANEGIDAARQTAGNVAGTVQRTMAQAGQMRTDAGLVASNLAQGASETLAGFRDRVGTTYGRAREGTGQVFRAGADLAAGTMTAISESGSAIYEGAQQEVQEMRQGLGEAYTGLGNVYTDVATGAADAYTGVSTRVAAGVNRGREMTGQVLGAAGNVLGAAGNVVSSVTGTVTGAGSDLLSGAQQGLGNTYTGVTTGIADAYSGAANRVAAGVNRGREMTGQVLGAAGNVVSSVTGTVTGAGSDLLSGARNIVQGAGESVGATLTGLRDLGSLIYDPAGFVRQMHLIEEDGADYVADREAPVETDATAFTMPAEEPSTLAGAMFNAFATGGTMLRDTVDMMGSGVDAINNFVGDTVITAISYATTQRRPAPDAVGGSASDTELEDIFADTGIPVAGTTGTGGVASGDGGTGVPVAGGTGAPLAGTAGTGDALTQTGGGGLLSGITNMLSSLANLPAGAYNYAFGGGAGGDDSSSSSSSSEEGHGEDAGDVGSARRPRGPRGRRPPTTRARTMLDAAFDFFAPGLQTMNDAVQNVGETLSAIYAATTAPTDPAVPEGIPGLSPEAVAGLAEGDRSPPARRVRRLARMATFLQEQLRLYTSYDRIRSGANEWPSTFAPEDLTSTELEDMTWLGLADHTDAGFFRSLPNRTSRLLSTVYMMVRKLRLPNIYALSFRNDSDFHLAVVGQLLNLYFTDGDGFVSIAPDRAFNGVQEKPEINARLHVLTEACQWGPMQRSPGLVPLMRCIHHNAGSPAVACPPGSHHKGRDRFLAPLEITMNDLILLADENFAHDGRCMVIRDSLVVLGIFHPTDPSKYILLDIILNMDEIENLMDKDPYGDPCGRVFRAIPDSKGTRWLLIVLLTIHSGRVWRAAWCEPAPRAPVRRL